MGSGLKPPYGVQPLMEDFIPQNEVKPIINLGITNFKVYQNASKHAIFLKVKIPLSVTGKLGAHPHFGHQPQV